MSDGTDVVVMVMERGAEWPNCVEACRKRTPNLVVIAQNNDESHESLAERVERRLELLERENRSVTAAAISISEGWGTSFLEWRCRVARALLRALDRAHCKDATLWLAAPANVSDTLRHHLMAIAGMLTTFLSAGIAIAVRFAEHAVPMQSGVYSMNARAPQLAVG